MHNAMPSDVNRRRPGPPPITLAEPSPGPRVDGFALWALGFRPFYLVASAFAAVSVPLWALQFAGWLGRSYLPGPLWHAHEMLFGFALAVIVGFLFTAGRNWTGRPTPTGLPLMAMVGLWLAARVLVLTPYGWAAAIANVAFPWAAAVGLAVPFVRAGNRRNYFFIALLVLLGAASGWVHLAELGAVAVPGWAALQIALDLVLFIIAVMAGRVVPLFTNNAVANAGASRRPLVEKAALGGVLLLMLADVCGVHGLPLAVVAGVVGAVHSIRWASWRPWRTRRVPLVWILHLGYLWVPIHLFLRALAAAGHVAPSAATHALTAGAIGGLVIGMMTRTARGHTARPLRADRWDVACYLLVLAGAMLRVGLPMFFPAHVVVSAPAAAITWSAGFALYTFRYWPVLLRSRLDGKPG